MSETLPTAIATRSQSLEPGDLVTLFVIDLNPIGVNVVLRYAAAETVFGGYTYSAVPIEADGFEWNGQGAMPQPKVRIANANRAIGGVSRLYNDLAGARLTRIRTYATFLDNGPTPDASAVYSLDIYDFEQKITHNNVMLEWSLAAAIDQEGRKIPGRRILRDLCMWRYRVYNPTTSTFDYSSVQCPYTGTNYFDANGNPTTAANDTCGRCVSDCKLRFGAKAVLPYGGFPGVARTRY